MRRRLRSWLKHVPAAAIAIAGTGLAFGLALGEHNPVRHAPAARAAQASDPARVIVRYRAGAAVLRAQAAQAGSGRALRHAAVLAARHGLVLADGRMLAEHTQLVRGQGIGSAALAAKLATDPDVEWAVVDGRRHALAAPNDPLYANGLGGDGPAVGQWYLRANGGGVKSSLDVEPAWARATGAGIVVAVLDTGITDHPDLNNQLVTGYDFVGYAVNDVATANDGDLDDADPHDPGDWITAAEDASGDFEGCGQSDSSWHGTQVAGLIGAQTGNSLGMAGLARDAQILPVRVLGKCGGYDSDIIAAMYWAAGLSSDTGLPANANPARVLNLSLGSQGECTAAYRSALEELAAAGVVVVAAAGNEGLAVGTPANCPGAVAVAGLRHIGSKVGYSDLGAEIVVGAPGGNCVNETGDCLYPLLSAVNTGTKAPLDPSYTTSFGHLTLGTSFSSPLVAGTAALMLSANPALTPAQTISALKSSARAFPSTGGDASSGTCQAPSDTPQDSECYCTTATCGAGMADAGAAVTRALNGPFPQVTASLRAPVVGSTVTVDGSASSALAGRSIASYQWAISQGGSRAHFTSATNASSATVQVTDAGMVELRLTVSDNQGQTATVPQALDAAASALSAVISATPTAPEAGDQINLSASESVTDAGRTLTAYQWEITAGSQLASFSGATNAATATLATSGAGAVTIRLTITDSAGLQASTSRSLTISAAPSSGGGGGALAPWWSLGLLLAAAALRRPRR